MLKIKEDKELKELEKFGFHINETNTAYWYDLKYDIHFYEDMEYEYSCWLGIYIKDRKLRIVDEFKCSKGSNRVFDVMNLNVIFDLIQAGLVEKVD